MRIAAIAAALLLAGVVLVTAGAFDDIQPPTSVPQLIPVPTTPSNAGSSGTTKSTSGSSGGGGGSAPPKQTTTNPPAGGTASSQSTTTSPYQLPSQTNTPPPDTEDTQYNIEPEYASEPDVQTPSSGGFFTVTTMLLILVPILVGAGAWYVLSHRKHAHEDSAREYTDSLAPPTQDSFPPLQVETTLPAGPLHTLMMSGAPALPQQPHVQFDSTTLRKAKQYVASLRGQNIPDHKIARAMREADWPAAYIDEAMKLNEDGGI